MCVLSSVICAVHKRKAFGFSFRFGFVCSKQTFSTFSIACLWNDWMPTHERNETKKKRRKRQFLRHPLYKTKWKVKSFPTTINVIVYASFFCLLIVVQFLLFVCSFQDRPMEVHDASSPIFYRNIQHQALDHISIQPFHQISLVWWAKAFTWCAKWKI